MLVGLFNTLFAYFIFFVLFRLGIHYKIALSVAYAGGIITGYILNRFWTFNAVDAIKQEFVKYLISYLLIFFVNVVLLSLIVENKILPAEFAQLLLLFLLSLASFVIQKKWVFRKTSKDTR